MLHTIALLVGPIFALDVLLFIWCYIRTYRKD